MKRVLVLCKGNSYCSIMAETLINALGAGRYEAVSAGSSSAGYTAIHLRPFMLSHRFWITVCLFFASTIAPAAATETLGKCYSHIEAYDQALAEEGVSEKNAAPLNAALSAAATACEAGKFAEADLQFAIAKSAYDALTAPAALTDADFWRVANYLWGHGSHRKGVEFLRTRINNDEQDDILGWHRNLDNPDGTYFEVAAVVKMPDGSVKYAYAPVPYNNNQQFGLCHPEGSYPVPKVTLQKWTAEELEELEIESAPYSITLDDGRCDKVHLFWPATYDGENAEVRFIFFRN